MFKKGTNIFGFGEHVKKNNRGGQPAVRQGRWPVCGVLCPPGPHDGRVHGDVHSRVAVRDGVVFSVMAAVSGVEGFGEPLVRRQVGSD
jgi:hypothetical protein